MTKKQKRLRIEIARETHEAPETVAERLKLAGGVNRFGEANYRAVWGWNRLAWIGGKFEEHDLATGSLLREVVELRQEPKYPAVNRWHLERWMAPESYGSARAWYAQTLEIANGRSVPALGPYPERGDYEHCFTLEGPRGEFVQLTATVAEHVARAIEWSRNKPAWLAGKRSACEQGAKGPRTTSMLSRCWMTRFRRFMHNRLCAWLDRRCLGLCEEAQ